MIQRHTRTPFIWMCVLSVCYAMASCASTTPTKQFLTPPAIAPAGTARIVFSRSSGPGWMTNSFVLSSPGAVAQASQGRPNEPVEYCHVRGQTRVKYVSLLDVCRIPLDLPMRLPLLDDDKRRWAYVLQVGCDMGYRTLVLAPPARYPTPVLDPELPSLSCVAGAEIGTVASGEQLEWLVEAGPLTVTIFPWLLSATLQAEAGRIYRLHFEYAKNKISVETQR